MNLRFLSALALAGMLVAQADPARASDVVVVATGAEEVAGEIACKLFAGPAGFPGGPATGGQQRSARHGGGAACRFRNVAPGTYAVVVALLPGGQADVSRDLFGRPKQPWGVSNNVRPALRKPAFAEASFRVTAGADAVLTVALAR